MSTYAWKLLELKSSCHNRLYSPPTAIIIPYRLLTAPTSTQTYTKTHIPTQTKIEIKAKIQTYTYTLAQIQI